MEGQPFQTTVQVDPAVVRKVAGEGRATIFTIMVCQHYTPGDDSLAGTSFQKADVALVPDGDGVLLHITPR